MILTPADLSALTQRERPSAQARVLDALGVPYATRPDGTLIVSRSVVMRLLGADNEFDRDLGGRRPLVHDRDAHGAAGEQHQGRVAA